MSLFGTSKKPVDDPARRARLETLTATVRRGLTAFAEVGKALELIQAEELWRLVSPTWQQWCADTLGLTERRVSQLVDASRTCLTLVSSGLKEPSSERVAREMAGLTPDEKVDVWREATAEAGESEPTAEMVAKAARKRKPKKPGRARMAKPVSLRVPGAAVRVVPRKNGWAGLVAALEHALQVAREREGGQRDAA